MSETEVKQTETVEETEVKQTEVKTEEKVPRLDFSETFEMIKMLNGENISDFLRDVLLTYTGTHNISVIKVMKEVREKLLNTMAELNSVPIVSAVSKLGVPVLLSLTEEEKIIVEVGEFGIWNKEEGFVENTDIPFVLREDKLKEVIAAIEETYDDSAKILMGFIEQQKEQQAAMAEETSDAQEPENNTNEGK